MERWPDVPACRESCNRKASRWRRNVIVGSLGLLGAGLLSGCIQNPVTGERELGFVSTAQQISIGEQQYLPAQQMQGGAYRVDPALQAYVQQVGERVAAASGIDLPYEFVVLNNSVPNAWALPGGKLAINRGLLTELANEAELAAVLGHEITHAAARHGAKAIERSTVSQVALLGIAIGAAGSDYAETALGAGQLAAGLLNQKYGRDAEREADFYGTRFMAEAGYDPYGAVTLQETFVRLSEGGNRSWLEGLFASHPASSERVANNRGLVQELRDEGFAGGEFNADAYQSALRQLRSDSAAYAAADDARRAIAEGRLDEAAELAARALEGQWEEAAFHGLRGEVRLRQARYADAVTNYDRAIARDPEYYAYPLGRGVARARLNERGSADADLRRSLTLFPTAVAYAELGRLAEGAGDVDGAVRLYRTAATSASPAGVAARERGLRLDLPRHPERYVAADLGRDADGRLLLQVANRAGMALDRVEVRIDVRDAAGRTGRRTTVLDDLAPGEVRLTLVGPGAADLAAAQATVTGARLAN